MYERVLRRVKKRAVRTGMGSSTEVTECQSSRGKVGKKSRVPYVGTVERHARTGNNIFHLLV